MLQSNLSHGDRTKATLANMETVPFEGENGIDSLLTFVRGFMRRQYGIVLFSTILCLAASAIYLRITPPIYTAQVQILVRNTKPQFVQQQSLVAEQPFDLAHMDTQLQILKSRGIALSVINELKLADDPELNGAKSLIHPIAQRIREWTGSTLKSPAETPDEFSDRIIAAFQERFSAARVNVSSVIEITFSWSDAVRSAQIANAIANAYVTDQLNAKFEANRTAMVWLQQRLRELGDQAETAERAVNAYKSEKNIVSSGGKLVDEQQVSELNSRLVAVRAQTSEVAARLHRYEAVLNTNAGDTQTTDNVAPGSDALASPIITTLRQQYLELARRESEYSAKVGKDHLSVVNLRNRMRDVRASILDEVRRLADSSRSDLEVAKQRQQEIEKQLAEAVSQSRTINSAEVTLRELESKAKNYRTLYDTFLQRYTGSVQQETFPISDARVISPASPPQSKSKPKTLVVLMLALFGGSGLGFGLGLIRDLTDRVFRTPGQVEAALGLPCLSVVPLLQAPKPQKPEAAAAPAGDQDVQQRAVSTASPLHWVVVNMPLSRFAEAIRSVKLWIDLNPSQISNKVIGITSSLPQEGKSTIAAALTQLIGQSGKSVIVVDCDLRNPSLSARLAPNASVGLLEVIFGSCPIEDAIWKDRQTNLALLPVVKRRRLTHSSEILTTEQMRKLLEKLRSTYDYVIIDLPPLTPIVDVRAASTLVDCFILVTEWGRTKIDVVQHALHSAPNVYDNLIGVVLNKTDIKAMGRYDAHKSDYYSDSHYVHYGLTDTA